MAKGVNHYFKDGKLHKGATHKHADGTVMAGRTMTKTSKKVFHYGDLSERAKATARKSWA